ncbi:MAG: hypothetical protein EAX96_01105 [Candidatus Lokiarchaeota archaeon]|nr:hypothetical protein [Candidatus Lokiarchaeota archaeon]
MKVIKLIEVKEKKIQVDIFVPLEACACIYEHFINSAFEVLMEYMDHVNFETKSLNSAEAQKLNLKQNSIVINGEKILTSSFALKKELLQLLK